jgi:hypothetical protein
MRRQPRSSTPTASVERISYRGIVLRNIATCLFRLSRAARGAAGAALTGQDPDRKIT